MRELDTKRVSHGGPITPAANSVGEGEASSLCRNRRAFQAALAEFGP